MRTTGLLTLIMYSLSQEESDRVRVLKFIAIIFVVYIHSYTTEMNFSYGADKLYLPQWLKLFEEGISQVIARCGVPVFFLISALLLFKSEKPYASTIKKKSVTLLFPYVLWNTFWIAVIIVLQALPFTAMYFSQGGTPILKCNFTDWLGLYGIGTLYPKCYPLWFMRDLIVVTACCPLIWAPVNKYPKIMLCIAVILVFAPFDFFAKTALAWFIIGAAMVKMRVHITAADKIPILLLTAIYIAGIIASLTLRLGAVQNAFIFIGVIFWTRLTKEIYVNGNLRKRFLWLSKWTFIIYVLHELTLTAVKKLCLKIFPQTPAYLLAEYAILPVLVILLCIAAAYVFEKAFPKAYALATGER